jgi:hypothetical protein
MYKTLKEGMSFGEYSFFTQAERDFSAKSAGFSVLYKIDREKFLTIIKENNDDYEKFCEIKDKISIYNKLEVVQKNCMVCEESVHFIMECPTIHYFPEKSRILLAHQYSQDQGRKK